MSVTKPTKANITSAATQGVCKTELDILIDYINSLTGSDGVKRATALPADEGGTGATTAAGALTNLGALAKAGGTMSGAIAMGANKITGLAAGNASGDAVNVGQLASYSPIPQSGVGVGKWYVLSVGNTATVSLPAGGTWAYFILVFNDAGTAYTADAAVAAGGTVIYGETTRTKIALVWRVA